DGTVAQVQGVGAAAWILLGVLALALLATAWGRVSAFPVLGALPLALAVPVLLAGRFADERAVASALRWGLAVCFVLCSVPLWWRAQLARLLWRRGGRIEENLDVSAVARWLLIATAVVPVVLLTVA